MYKLIYVFFLQSPSTSSTSTGIAWDLEKNRAVAAPEGEGTVAELFYGNIDW